MKYHRKMALEIYTDGSCIGNGQAGAPGGWAWALVYNGELAEIRSGSVVGTTNNQMELYAAIKALSSFPDESVTIVTDSEYVMNGITKWMENWKKNGWKTSSRKPVKNADQWQCLDKLTAKRVVQWRHVRAHTGDKFNEMVDAEAKNRAIGAYSVESTHMEECILLAALT